MKDNNPPEPAPICINGKVYPLWSQFVHRKHEWIGGVIHSFEDGQVFKGVLSDIVLEANGSDSAFMHFDTEDGNRIGADVGYLGILANPDNDGALMFGGYGGHSWKIWTKSQFDKIK